MLNAVAHSYLFNTFELLFIDAVEHHMIANKVYPQSI